MTTTDAPPTSIRARLDRLAAAAVTPLAPSDVLDIFAPLRAGADLRGRVVARTSQTADAASLLIKPGRDWAGHVPGQYVRIGVDVDGVRHWRTYSLTHGPRPDRLIEITVKAIPDGVVSGHLVREVAVGDYVQLGQAAGDFVLPDPLPERLLLVTAGSGVTPVIGMLRNLALDTRRADLPDITVVHSALTAADSIYGAELAGYAADGLIRLVALHTDTDGLLSVGDPASRTDLAALVPDWADRVGYACGPAGLLDALEAHFGAADVPLHTERFRPVVAEPGEGGEATYGRAEVIVEADGATSLLDAGEAAGVLMPSGCRMGVCFGCVVPLVSGTVRDLRDGNLTHASDSPDADGVYVQTCINAAAGPCHLDV